MNRNENGKIRLSHLGYFAVAYALILSKIAVASMLYSTYKMLQQIVEGEEIVISRRNSLILFAEGFETIGYLLFLGLSSWALHILCKFFVELKPVRELSMNSNCKCYFSLFSPFWGEWNSFEISVVSFLCSLSLKHWLHCLNKTRYPFLGSSTLGQSQYFLLLLFKVFTLAWKLSSITTNFSKTTSN